MSNMPELGDAGEDRTRKISQPVEEDSIGADARQKAKSVYAKHLRADTQSCQPGNFVVHRFNQYKASVCKSMESKQSCAMQMPLAID